MAGMAQVMNQSLTPTRLDSKMPFTPSNYPDKRSVVAAYKRMVKLGVCCIPAVACDIMCCHCGPFAKGTNGAGVSGRAQHASERFAHFPCVSVGGCG